MWAAWQSSRTRFLAKMDERNSDEDQWAARHEAASDRWARFRYRHASSEDEGEVLVGALADFVCEGRFSGAPSLAAAVFWSNTLEPVSAGERFGMPTTWRPRARAHRGVCQPMRELTLRPRGGHAGRRLRPVVAGPR